MAGVTAARVGFGRVSRHQPTDGAPRRVGRAGDTRRLARPKLTALARPPYDVRWPSTATTS